VAPQQAPGAEILVSIGASPYTTLRGSTIKNGEAQRAKLEGPRGMGFLGRGPPHQLGVMGSATSSSVGPGRSPVTWLFMAALRSRCGHYVFAL